MSSDFYYEPPEDSEFEDLKTQAIRIWSEYDNTYGYADEKQGRIKDLENVRDNFMFMVAMFDMSNQQKLASRLRDVTRHEIRLRLMAGGQPEEYIVF